MPQVINFDVLTADTVEVAKTIGGVHRVWRLRDDVSAEVLMRFFELARAQTAEVSADDVVAQFRTAERVYLAVLLDIFRHTYPETTEEELRAGFTFEQRKQLVDLFFSLAGIGSNAPSNGTPAGTSAGTPAGTQATTASNGVTVPAITPAGTPRANRAARRASRKTTATATATATAK